MPMPLPTLPAPAARCDAATGPGRPVARSHKPLAVLLLALCPIGPALAASSSQTMALSGNTAFFPAFSTLFPGATLLGADIEVHLQVGLHFEVNNLQSAGLFEARMTNELYFSWAPDAFGLVGLTDFGSGTVTATSAAFSVPAFTQQVVDSVVLFNGRYTETRFAFDRDFGVPVLHAVLRQSVEVFQHTPPGAQVATFIDNPIGSVTVHYDYLPPAVPEPGAWLLALAGLPLVAAVARGARRRPAPA